MTRDDILSAAREAGFKERNGIVRTMHSSGAWVGINEELERFAALIAAAEREACALVCEASAGTVSMFTSMRAAQHHNHAVKGCAAAIRARGNP